MQPLGPAAVPDGPAARLEMACRWITDVAQLKTEKLPAGIESRHKHSYWKGSVMGEYRPASGRWSYYCPVWHTGQALKALCMAAPLVTDSRKLVESARLAADFIMAQRINDGDDEGLILAYEDDPANTNTSAILECLDGLFFFAELTGEKTYSDAALRAVDWVARKAYMDGEGLFRDCYDPAAKMFLPGRYGTPGRPLLDDGVFLKAFRLSGNRRWREIFFETAARLLADEDPPGNWIAYAPCNRKRGNIHPRHAYWWGRPFLGAWAETGEAKYLDCALRAAEWYRKAMRRDGGLFRGTYADFSTDSFGHASSGIACAVILWLETSAAAKRPDYAEPVARAMSFLERMQFTRPADPNLAGCVLEKVNPPDGTDRLPYHVRDLGTIFFVQALSLAMRNWNCAGEPHAAQKK